MINKKLLKDKKLSWKAKGILSYLMSLPNDWKIYLSEISRHSSNGKESLRSGIIELIERGYIDRFENRNKKGQIKGYTYFVYEKPKPRKPKTGNPITDKPDTGNQPLLNNDDILNNKRTNKKLKVADKSSNNDFDLKCSNRLHKVLIKKRKIFRTVNKSQWARTFKKFRIDNNLKKKEIKETLKWYIDHIGNKYTPKAYSAKSFCDKFVKIQDAMENDRVKDLIDTNEYTVPKVRKVKRKKK